MKTYKQFVEGCGCPHSKKKKKTNVAEAVPLLAAPLAIPVGKAIGAGLAATGLTGMIMQARRQGEEKDHSQSIMGKVVQQLLVPDVVPKEHIGRIEAPRDRRIRQGKIEEQKQNVERRRERSRQRDVEQKIDDLIGSEADRKYAKQKRQERGIEEGMLPVPSDKRKRIINPMVAAMPPKTEKGINNAMKKGLDDLNTKYQKLYDKLNSVPKDGKA